MLFKRFKLNFLVVAGLMLAFIGFASLSEAGAQELCPGVPFDNGWLRIDVTPSAAPNTASFTAGLMGSIETDLSATRGGIDWLYNDDSFLDQESNSSENRVGINTNAVGGSQLVGWWSQKGGRSTQVQVSVASDVSMQSSELGTDALGAPLPLSIHVQLLDENCVEVLDFCDSYTPLDSHIYDLANLVTNAGVNIPASQLVGNEGTILITTVVSCPTDDRAISYDFLFGTSRIINTGKYDLGTNLWARDTITATPQPTPDPTDPGCTDQVPAGGGSAGTAFVLNGSVDSGGNTADCRLRTLVPTQLSQNFSILPTSVAARADVVLINFADSYNDGQPTLGYVPLAATSTFLPDIVDVNETPVSCPSQPVCFARLGIDDAQVNTDTPLPTPTPTPSPSPSPGASPSPGTSPGASPTPSTSPNGGGGGGGGSCAISGVAGGSASASALADILIPLLPVFGFGLVRRVVSRRRKEEK